MNHNANEPLIGWTWQHVQAHLFSIKFGHNETKLMEGGNYLDSVRVRRAFGSVNEFVCQTFGNGLDIAEGRFTSL